MEEAPRGDDVLLDELSRRCFLFFWNEADPKTGLIQDKAPADGSGGTQDASIASTGFGLGAICAAAERGWVSRDEAYERILMTLHFIWSDMPHEHGFFYHFVDPATGRRAGGCELSSIDTALLVAGALTAKQYFSGTEVATLAGKIYERVDWPWMLHGGNTLRMAWKPESGFENSRWERYSEHMMMTLLAIGSPSHPLPEGAWHSWRREPVTEFGGRRFLECPPLFTHQYSHSLFDFRNTRDAYADYWQNSVLATLAQREMIAGLSSQFPLYSTNLWGLTSSDGLGGYMAWGGPPLTHYQPPDGSVVPCAPGGSIPFAPKECIAVLKHIYDNYRDRAWKEYGFVDAFNPHTDWNSRVVIGIDAGVTLNMIENYRNGFFWKYFMRNDEVRTAMSKAGFVSTANTFRDEDYAYLRSVAEDTWACIADLVHPETGMPEDSSRRSGKTSVSNLGLYLSDVAAAWKMGFITRKEAAERIRRTLSSISKLETCFGFRQCWNTVDTLERSPDDPWISLLDSGNFAAGLITVGQAFPEFRETCDRIFAAMDWGAFYDRARNTMIGGYNVVEQKFNPQWTLPLIGTDARLAVFFAVSTDNAPLALWDRLDRSAEEFQHTRYFTPGWQGGGLFMQFVNGLWLDEKDSVMRQSAENFAYAQIVYAREKNYPVWGWSASDSPDDGYLGWGKLQDRIVTPHASALALDAYPDVVLANLRRLESMGARSKRFGFYDSIDIETGKHSDGFLMLDQSMLFLSLANFLEENAVRGWFQSNRSVAFGRSRIAEFRDPGFGPNNALFDISAGAVRLLSRETKPQPETIARQRGKGELAWVELTPENALEASPPEANLSGFSARFAFAWDETALFFTMQVVDTTVTNDYEASVLFQGDCVELYVDPECNGLVWNDRHDFQFGFAVDDKSWEWFGGGKDIRTQVRRNTDGYSVKAELPWTRLGVKPEKGRTVCVSPAVKNLLEEGPDFAKLNWNWQPKGSGIQLGRITLE
ncbi:MAG: DUF3131 domain-containing protein [Verrucomicrobia bacterium]|nr:DUF3131 domain-containing protein [Verrucomicrobiota bacterium]